MSTKAHLTYSERIIIEQCLNEAKSFQFISKNLNRHCSTISREILRHYRFRKTGSHGHPFNDCLYRKDCTNRNLCSDKNCFKSFCRRCTKCSIHCSDYTKEHCPLLDNPPYVCNGCTYRFQCTLEKKEYRAAYAQKEYEVTLSESRSGLRISKEELTALDQFLTPLLQNGQSIDHILAHNPGKTSLSRRTLYNYIDAGVLSAKNIDLPRKVRFRSRESIRKSQHVGRSCRLGRSYKDYLIYMKQHPQCPIVEMDSVEGIKGGKVLLTIHFVKSEFMLAFLRKRNTARSVYDVFENLYHRFDPITFHRLFPILLVDNGCEFSDPDSLERDSHNNLRTKVFYCNPLAPYQKGAAENNHTFIRRILPKGTSFNNFTQQDINLMMSHINSYSRSTLSNQTPYQAFLEYYGKDVLELLDVSLIPPNDIILRPKLLR